MRGGGECPVKGNEGGEQRRLASGGRGLRRGLRDRHWALGEALRLCVGEIRAPCVC